MTLNKDRKRWTVTFHRKALRELSRLPKSVVQRSLARIEDLEIDPFPIGSRPLKEQKNLYRIRVGHYRIVYHVNTDAKSIRVLRVAHRKDVYKDL
jgi:mRNA interferase RelE/StbE